MTCLRLLAHSSAGDLTRTPSHLSSLSLSSLLRFTGVIPRATPDEAAYIEKQIGKRTSLALSSPLLSSPPSPIHEGRLNHSSITRYRVSAIVISDGTSREKAVLVLPIRFFRDEVATVLLPEFPQSACACDCGVACCRCTASVRARAMLMSKCRGRRTCLRRFLLTAASDEEVGRTRQGMSFG